MFFLTVLGAFIGQAAPALDEDLYAGRTLEAWRELMSQIELRDPASREFVPGLIVLMNAPQAPWATRRQAALTLGRLGPLAREALPQVIAHLDETDADDPESSPQRWALSSLALFGREAKSAAPALIRLLNDPSSSMITQLGCLEALSQIGSAEPAGIQALLQNLELRMDARTAPEIELARAAAEALGYLGSDAATAVPVLQRAAQADDELLRQAATASLGKIGSQARGAQPLLLDLLVGDDAALVRDAATTALGQIGPDAWPMLAPLLCDEDAEIRERAVNVAGAWRSATATIAPRIELLLADREPRVQLAAARSWRQLTRRHDRVWPVLVEMLNDADRQIRRGASQELQAIVKTGAASDDDFRALEIDPRAVVRQEALRLQRLRPLRTTPE